VRNPVDVIFEYFYSHGAEQYLGEPVTLREHMLQTARHAELDGASVELIAASLLHDVGHMIHGERDDTTRIGIDLDHEEIGYRFLSSHFPASVVDPVRLHVAAKRYLCTVDDSYLDVLSRASKLSFDLQGGPMSAEEVAAFESEPFFEAACKLRRYDDAAKDPAGETPQLEHYRAVLEAVVER